MRTIFLAALLVSAMVLAAAHASGPSIQQPYPGMLDEHSAIQYATRTPRDPVARLLERLNRGEVRLRAEGPSGYLRSVLEALGISPESQILLFSKTALQRAHTSPETPRALYFNDAVVVGYIPGARYLEIASQDPEQGVIFYTIDQAAVAAPEVTRRTNCLTCHVSGSTREVPGLIVRSNFVDAGGNVIPQLGFHLVNHATPLAQRWGGWFVSGTYEAPPYGGVGHMGSVATTVHPVRGDVASVSNEIFIRWMNSTPQALGYPSADSDIAALMIFDHQMHAMNLLTRLNWETRVAARAGRSDFSGGTLRDLAIEVADYLLFVGEVAPPARLTPRSGFAAWFTSEGPRDRRGRSLRELDLERRLMRYPLSYMVYSAAFDHLPPPAKHAIYRHWRAVLSGDEPSPTYAHLTPPLRAAIREILADTKPDFR